MPTRALARPHINTYIYGHKFPAGLSRTTGRVRVTRARAKWTENIPINYAVIVSALARNYIYVRDGTGHGPSARASNEV